ncbi:MAG: hypothetical protein KC416_08465 [Myxococcales bacterium]|nr:hypothetical protein [Myxococcales bacterium]
MPIDRPLAPRGRLVPWAITLLGLLPACGGNPEARPVTDARPPVDPAPSEDGSSPEDDGATTPVCTPPRFAVFQTTTRLMRVGTLGPGHDLDIGSITFAVEVLSCDADCVCSFRGPVATNDIPEVAVANEPSPWRCPTSLESTCTPGTTCMGGLPCSYHLGPPFAAVFAGFPSCVSIHFQDAPASTVGPKDPILGTLTLSPSAEVQFDQFRLHVRQGQNCPTCVGDTTPLDGVKEGKCKKGSTQTNTACDIHREYPANGGETYDGSFDCGFEPQPLFPDLDLNLAPLKTAGAVWTLESGGPNCKSEPGTECWCGVCQGTPSRACHDQNDCGGNVKCIAAPESKPDACAGDCRISDTAHGTGSCSDAHKAACFGGEGEVGRKIIAKGANGVFEGEFADVRVGGLTCIPGDPVANIAHKVLGLPGPGMFELDVRIQRIE